MTHRKFLREWQNNPVYAMVSLLTRRLDFGLAAIESNCPLCELPAQGGKLCCFCKNWLKASLPHSFRCRCCYLPMVKALTPCPACHTLRPVFKRIIAAFDYIAPADLLIHRFKSQKQLHLMTALTSLLYDAIAHDDQSLPKELILVPVPSSPNALVQRGFNPAGVLAQALAHKLKRPCRLDILYRVRQGHKQTLQGHEARSLAVEGLYAVQKEIRGVPVAVVDDVFTTGNTLNTIAQALLEAGASSVIGLVLARTPRHSIPTGA